jgi:DNA (cytosine-5)-methyltransferase 1
VREAIADLPGPAGVGGKVRKEFEWVAYPEGVVPSAYAKRLRRPRAGASKLAKEWLARGFVSGLMPTAHSPEVVARYLATAPGTPDRKSRSFRLAWNGQCPTLRAGTAQDKGAFQAVRPIHPDGERVITAREAARITGFPDCHLFATSTWGSFRMIGNSVPVPLSESIMDIVAAALAAGGSEAEMAA